MSNPLYQEEQFARAVAQLERGQAFDDAINLLDDSSAGQVKPLLEIVVAAQKLPSYSLPAERRKALATALSTKLATTPPIIGPVADARLIMPFALEARRLRPNNWGSKITSALAAVALLVLVFGGLFWLAQQAPEQPGAIPTPMATITPLVLTVGLTETVSPTTTNTWGNQTPTTVAETAQTTVKAAYNTYTPKPATTGGYIARTTVASGSTTSATNTNETTTTTATVDSTNPQPPLAPTPTPELRSTSEVKTTSAPNTTANTTRVPNANSTPVVQPTPRPTQTTENTSTPEPSKTPKTSSPTPAPTTDSQGKGGGGNGNGGGNKTPKPTKTPK